MPDPNNPDDGVDPSGALAAPWILAAYETLTAFVATYSAYAFGNGMPMWLAGLASGETAGYNGIMAYIYMNQLIGALPWVALAAFGINEINYALQVEEYWRLSWQRGNRVATDPLFEAKWKWNKRPHWTKEQELARYYQRIAEGRPGYAPKKYWQPGAPTGYLPGQLPGMKFPRMPRMPGFKQPAHFKNFGNSNDPSAFRTIYIGRNAEKDRFRRVPK